MQILITAENITGENVVLSYQYQRVLQAAIYHFNKDIAFGKFLHDEGYVYDNRTFRLFSFSNILQKPIQLLQKQHKFVFPTQISWVVSSVENPLIDAVVQTVIREKCFQLGQNTMRFTGFSILPDYQGNQFSVCTLSPISTYSTVEMPNGKKRTIYYHYKEQEFAEIVHRNLEKKFCAFYGHNPQDNHFSMRFYGRPRELVTAYQRFIIKGWMGELMVSGSEEMLHMAFCAGLGSKNAQGFGLIVPKEIKKELI